MKRKASTTSNNAQPFCSKQARCETSLRYEYCAKSIPTWLQELPTVTIASAPQMDAAPNSTSQQEKEAEEEVEKENDIETNSVWLIEPVVIAPPSDDGIPASSIDEPRTLTESSSNRYTDPHYRLLLEEHGVIVDGDVLLLPADVRSYVQDLIKKRRDSPELGAEQLTCFAQLRRRLQVMIEATLQSEILGDTALFPNRNQYKTGTGESLIERLEHHQFPPLSVPCNPEAKRALVSPKPDVLYGYAPEAFRIPPASKQQRLLDVIDRPELKSADPTNHNCFWPFFATEFKSHRGSIFEAENQNAGSGASNVKSFQTLIALAYPEEVPSLQESLVFSCTFSPIQARISVHWRDLLEGDEAPFMDAEIKDYNLRVPEHVQALRTCLFNIVDWALEERLPVIQKALMTYDALKNNIPIMEHELFSKIMGSEANVELVPSAASGVVHD